jgi:hypothetical protein
MVALHCFFNLTAGPLLKLNGALLTLLPKSETAERPGDYRPINLIHSFAKLVSKIMAMRLAHHINGLVSNAHSAFIRRWCIHEDFLYVQNLARAFHRKKPLHC